ncbi:hypothetical protein HMPREF3293_03038 [Christensenella minuta]|uniref:Uncharacterized protein n=1 Tax=Christensenella minuta TaxID=626937 RepID=A0A136Q0F4_9FIRM|nr:hypothetical protein HMPREF3293_03038 [Christensenella minuta]
MSGLTFAYLLLENTFFYTLVQIRYDICSSILYVLSFLYHSF